MKKNKKIMKKQDLYMVLSSEDVITSVTETRSGLKTIWSSLHPSFDIDKFIFSGHQINYGDDLDQIYLPLLYPNPTSYKKFYLLLL